MGGRGVKLISKNANTYYSPPIGVRDGLTFEEFIFRQMTIKNGAIGKNLTIERSPRSGDDGRDIIITGTLNKLFGQRILYKGNIICEIKYSSGRLLRLSSFASTILRAQKGVDHIVIISNNLPSPRTVFHTYRQCQINGKSLTFISGPTLNEYFNESESNQDDYLIGIQIDNRNYPHKFHYYLKNLSSSKVKYFKLASKNDEYIKLDSELEFYLNPGELQTGEVVIIDNGETINPKKFKLTTSIDDSDQTVTINRTIDTTTITLPFWGYDNLLKLSTCNEKFSKSQASAAFLLEGSAGIGKSRFINELSKLLRSKGQPVLVINSDNIHDVKKVRKIVIKESELFLGPFDSFEKENNIRRVILTLESDPLLYPILIFDDIHKLKNEDFEILKREISNFKIKNQFRILLSSRNDTTFFNPEYFKFSEWFRCSKHITQSILLKPLILNEEKSLLKNLIKGAPSLLIERIRYISNGNPYYLIIALEWLVENNIFQIINNQRVAVINNERFARINLLPLQVDEMFHQALLKLIENTSTQQISRCFIIGWGDSFDDLFPIVSNINSKYTSIFFTIDNDSKTIWRHDLAKSAFIRLILESNDFISILKQVYTMELKCQTFSNEKLGQIAFKLNDPIIAWNKFELLKKEVLSINNFTSIDFKNEYFDILPLLSRLAFSIKEKNIAIRSLIVWCYLGCHNANIALGRSSCEEAISLINEYLNINERSQCSLLIDMLKLRTLIDAGLMDQTREMMIKCKIQYTDFIEHQDIEQKFDYYLNYSDIYCLWNYRMAASHYLNLSDLNNESMPSELDYVIKTHRNRLIQDPETRLEKLKCLSMVDKITISDRHLSITKSEYYRLKVLMVKLNEKQVYETYNELLELVQHMVKCKYLSALPIVYRALSVSAFSAMSYGICDIQTVKRLYQAAESSCILKGESASLPYVLNDLGILEFRITNRLQDSMSYFNTAIEILNKQNRLDLGNCDLLCGNQVLVSNYLKMLCKVKYSLAIDFILKRISWFGKSKVASRQWAVNELDRIVDSNEIFLFESKSIFKLRCSLSNLNLIG